jgi:hypothetical protein
MRTGWVTELNEKSGQKSQLTSTRIHYHRRNKQHKCKQSDGHHAAGSSLLSSRRFIHAPQSVQTPGIADIRQTLGDDFDEKLLVIAHLHITGGVAGELWLAATLSGQKTEGDHLTLLVVQSLPSVVIAEAVIRQPAVDVAALLWAGLPEVFHSLPENVHLCL